MMLNMKLIFSLVLAYFAINNGMGAPTARYKFVRCNPSGGKSNCVTHQSAAMALDPGLPSRLPALAAQYLEAESVLEEEGPGRDDSKDDSLVVATVPEEGSDDSLMMATVPEEGSGAFEGSAAEFTFMADRPSAADDFQGLRNDAKNMELLLDDAKPAEHELREDHLLL